MWAFGVLSAKTKELEQWLRMFVCCLLDIRKSYVLFNVVYRRYIAGAELQDRVRS